MSDQTIRVGDLVRVAHWPCCGGGTMIIGTVVRFCVLYGIGDCFFCNAKRIVDYGEPVAVLDNNDQIPVAWLKRIPPLAALESADEKEEVTA